MENGVYKKNHLEKGKHEGCKDFKRKRIRKNSLEKERPNLLPLFVSNLESICGYFLYSTEYQVGRIKIFSLRVEVILIE